MTTVSTSIGEVPLRDRWHSGERAMQDLLQVQSSMEPKSAMFRPFLTTQMQEFVPGLHYMFLSTLDGKGRPWVSMLTGTPGFMNSPNDKTLMIKTDAFVNRDKEGSRDPILDNLKNGQTFKDGRMMWGGVALDFSNRRRNKMNGTLYPSGIIKADLQSGQLDINLSVEQTIGNCPKYITIRKIIPKQQQQQEIVVKVEREEGKNERVLNNRSIGIIQKADCVFLGSRFIDESLPDQTSGMDCNHRGGNPGFVRVVSTNSEATTLLLPDYSGNRFFNSLGNIYNDARVGLLFMDCDNGSTLHVTGRATILSGNDSLAVYPRAQRCLSIVVDDYKVIENSLPFTFQTVELSPYNPVLTTKTTVKSQQQEPTQAKLYNITSHSPDVASFHFKTTNPIQYHAGQYAVLDFSKFNRIGYQHMSPDNPKSVNDDFVRTWTITSSQSPQQKTNDYEFSVTVKRQPGGTISNLLHNIDPIKLYKLQEDQVSFTIPLLTIDGDFTLNSIIQKLNNNNGEEVNEIKLTMFAGGIGITPFISMIRSLQQQQSATHKLPRIDIHLIVSGKSNIDLLPGVLSELDKINQSSLNVNLNISGFVTANNSNNSTFLGTINNMKIYESRLTKDLLVQLVPDIKTRQSLICGPDSFMTAVENYLQQLDVPTSSVHKEDFNF